jgi:hypothetical protein
MMRNVTAVNLLSDPAREICDKKHRDETLVYKMDGLGVCALVDR